MMNINMEKKSPNYVMIDFAIFMILNIVIIGFLGNKIGKIMVILYVSIRLLLISIKFLIIFIRIAKKLLRYCIRRRSNEDELYDENELMIANNFSIVIFAIELCVINEIGLFIMKKFAGVLRYVNPSKLLLPLIFIELFYAITQIYIKKRYYYLEC